MIVKCFRGSVLVPPKDRNGKVERCRKKEKDRSLPKPMDSQAVLARDELRDTLNDHIFFDNKNYYNKLY